MSNAFSNYLISRCWQRDSVDTPIDWSGKARLIKLSEGTRVRIPSDKSNEFYFLIKGSIILRFDGPLKIIWSVSPGHWFGGVGLVAAAEGVEEWQTIRPCALLALSRQFVDEALESEPASMRKVGSIYSDFGNLSFQNTVAQLSESAWERVVVHLWRLSIDDEEERLAKELFLTQKLLGELCSLSRLTVSKMLGRLEKKGIVSRGYKKIAVLDRIALKRIVKKAM